MLAAGLLGPVPARAAPPNDDLTNALEVGLPFADERDTTGASEELGEPLSSCPGAGATVWYRFRPTQDELVSVDTFRTSFDSVLTVYEGTGATDRRQVGCSDSYFLSYGEHVLFQAKASKTYYIQVGGFDGQTGTLRFRLRATSPLALDGGRRYIPMADGTELAAYVTFPPGWDGSPLPVLFEYDAVDGGARPGPTPGLLDEDGEYIWVHAGARGSGCSAGRLEPFGDQAAEDGAALIAWIAEQSWSDGSVAIVGYEGSGRMGAAVAAQRPPALKAVSISGVIEDVYRDFVYPGGVFNASLPGLYVAALRQASETRKMVAPSGGAYSANGLPAEPFTDRRCAQNIASRPPGTPDLLVRGLTETEDSEWWRSLSPPTEQIEAPTQVFGTYQDEQTLARGPAVMWERLTTVHKQLILTNGSHNAWTGLGGFKDAYVIGIRKAWLDRWLRGDENGVEQSRVHVLLESHFRDGRIQHSGVLTSDRFPLAQTEWTKLFVNANRRLTASPPSDEGVDSYVSGVGRHLSPVDPGSIDFSGGQGPAQEASWSAGPDAVSYKTDPADEPLVVAGPLVATLHARIHGVDAALFVQIADEGPNGELSLLQRGMLKASHRRVLAERSWFDGDVLYRPWHPHTDPQLLTPGEEVVLDVEIWPVGFVLRPGHRLVMTVTSPPALDGLSAWQANTPPSLVDILHGGGRASSLLVPFVTVPASLGAELACGAQVAVRCAKPLVND